MAKTAEVIIIGGGVIGCSVAYHLALAGVKDVLVLERGTVGGEASGAAAGMLAPQCEASGPGPFLDFCLAGRSYYERLSQELRELTGLDVEYLQWGTLYLLDEEGDPAAEGRLRWQRELGLHVERLSVEEVFALEPGITKGVGGALYFPDDHHVNNVELVKALAQAACFKGARILEGQSVTGFVLDGDRVAGVKVLGGMFLGEKIVCSAGSWCGPLGAELGRRVPVEPARGQIVSVECSVPSLRHVVWGKGVYLVPRLDSRLLVGSTVEHVGFDKRVTMGGVRQLVQAALEILPPLIEGTFERAWAGLRPRSKDGLPLIGPLQGLEGMYLATGHFRNGILLGPLTGRLVAELILGRTPSFPIEAFSPARFGL